MNGFNIIGPSEIARPLQPVNWICEGLLIAPGAPTIVAGYGFTGKSICLQALALAVATGQPVWERYPTLKGRVLHLDYEQGRRTTCSRYQRIAYAMRTSIEESLLEVGVLPSTSLTVDHLQALGEGRRLVLIDSWRAAHPGVDENSSDVRKSLDCMSYASEKTGCAFTVVHHAKKDQGQGDQRAASQMLRGSSGFFDGAQTIYYMKRLDYGRNLLTLQKDRSDEGREVKLELLISKVDYGKGLRITCLEAFQDL